jgi:uncharacterized RDD family membrane protein YckC
MSDESIVWLPPAGAAGQQPLETPGPPRPAVVYAPFGRRAGAYLLDLVIQLAFAVVVTFILFGPSIAEEDGEVDRTLDAASYAITVVATLLYYGLLMRRPGTRNGQTWGRQAAGVRVVRDDGRPVTAPFAAWRDYIVKGLLTAVTLGINLLWPLWERENRTLHDLVLRTHVIAVEPD